MSSGHSNGVELLNLYRTPIHYDCGHNYEDCLKKPIPVMSDVAAWLERGDRSHTDVDSFPPDYMDQFTRDPLPQDIIWDLGTRADSRQVENWYYLKAPYTTNTGIIQAVYDRNTNEIRIRTKEVQGEFSIISKDRLCILRREYADKVSGFLISGQPPQSYPCSRDP